MTAVSTPYCRMVDALGQEICEGRVLASGAGDGVVLIGALNRPGLVVQRCLLGGVRRVHIRFDDGRSLPATVEQVFLHPAFGRVCQARLSVDAALATREPVAI
jgi:hypothetical protein